VQVVQFMQVLKLCRSLISLLFLFYLGSFVFLQPTPNPPPKREDFLRSSVFFLLSFSSRRWSGRCPTSLPARSATGASHRHSDFYCSFCSRICICADFSQIFSRLFPDPPYHGKPQERSFVPCREGRDNRPCG
jgi:hypothetical protein